jgi:branched-chain amino acid transport system ATP-binding protein
MGDLVLQMFITGIIMAMLEINREGESILLVEQNAAIALKLAHRGYVFETGNLVISGDTKDLLDDQYVKRAYLGR